MFEGGRINSDKYTPAFINGLKSSLNQVIDPDKYEKKFFSKGEIIYDAGEKLKHLYYISSGIAKVCFRGDSNNEQITHLAVAGEYLGYDNIINNLRCCTYSEALGETTLHLIPHKTFLHLLWGNKLLLELFYLALACDTIAKTKKLSDFAYKPLRGRLSDALLLLEKKYSKYDDGFIALSKAELANYIGSGRESTSRMLSEFRNENIIASNGNSIEIINRPKLIKISNLYS
jgi:CRP-like cAMP-binding protein